MEKFEKLPKNRCFSATHRRLLAGRTLEKLKAGQLEILSEVVSDFERLEDIKNKESTIKIKSWFAGDRKEDKNQTTFTYWIERDYGNGCKSMPTGVEVKKVDNTWKVVSFVPTY